MNTIEIRKALETLDPNARLYELPKWMFSTGGPITNACYLAGYTENGDVVVNNLNRWGDTVHTFEEFLSTIPAA